MLTRGENIVRIIASSDHIKRTLPSSFVQQVASTVALAQSGLKRYDRLRNYFTVYS